MTSTKSSHAAGRWSRGGADGPQREELIRHLFYGFLLHKLLALLFYTLGFVLLGVWMV